MDEEEKIFVGKMFDPCKDELIEIKHKAHITCQRFNAMDEYDTNRLPMIKEILGAIGEGYYLQGPVQFNYGCHTYIGSNFFANFNLVVLDDAEIHIGDNVCLGPNVSLMAASHPLLANERMSLDAHGNKVLAEYAKGITIGSNVWIGSDVVIVDGVHIGNGAVIGAGSVVTKDVKANALCYGNPCKIVRTIGKADSKKQLILEEDMMHFMHI